MSLRLPVASDSPIVVTVPTVTILGAAPGSTQQTTTNGPQTPPQTTTQAVPHPVVTSNSPQPLSDGEGSSSSGSSDRDSEGALDGHSDGGSKSGPGTGLGPAGGNSSIPATSDGGDTSSSSAPTKSVNFCAFDCLTDFA
jgi:hypothetical protein